MMSSSSFPTVVVVVVVVVELPINASLHSGADVLRAADPEPGAVFQSNTDVLLGIIGRIQQLLWS